MGEFNDWKGQPMAKGSDGVWSANVALSPGSYGYKFLVNGSEWILDPVNPNRKTVNGVDNSSVEVKAGESAAPPLVSTPTPSGSVASSEHAHLDFNVLAERKRFDFARSGTTSSVTTKEKWGYKVTLENKSFSAATGLEVQYRQFKLNDKVVGGTNLVASGGSTKIDTLRTGEKTTFETTPVEMERFALRPGWVFSSDEAKEKTKDRMAGLWLRVLRDGELVFEWQSSPELKQSATWE
ncbi:MAG: hypothetical protein M3Y86_09235 [Verrucomicrobiota bacterium]|nr:hypothetical protein [Verrucomicrobiota bacterium]